MRAERADLTGSGGRQARHADIRRVLVLTLVANIVVVVAKAIAGVMAHSLAVLADAAHSSVDAWNNVMSLVLTRVAAKDPDEDHPYGHAKFETLGALAIVAFLSITVFQLVTAAVVRLAGHGRPPNATPLAIGVMIVSALINTGVAYYENRAGKLLGSEILIADSAHTRSDVFASIAVVFGLFLVAAGFPKADPIFTLLVAIIIARTGWRILQHTVPILVDERAVSEETIRGLARATEGVRDCFHVRSRGREGEIFAELTITVDGAMNVEQAHDIADAVERHIEKSVGARQVVVHVEPDHGHA